MLSQLWATSREHATRRTWTKTKSALIFIPDLSSFPSSIPGILNWPNTLSVTCCLGICVNLHWESTIVGIFVFLLFLPLVIPAHPRYWHNIIPPGETGPRRDKQTWRNVFFFSFLNQNQNLEMIDLLCVWRKNWTKKRMMCLRSGCVQIEVHLG